LANLPLAERVLIAGQGTRLAEVARAGADDGIHADRDARASPVEVITHLAERESGAAGRPSSPSTGTSSG